MKNTHLEHITMGLTEGSASDTQKIEKIFYFVRDEIKFDMVANQFMSAEEVLKAKKGACMNKALLLHDMAKKAGVPARLHFMRVKKTALEDLLHPAAYKLWPDNFFHTYAEVQLNNTWIPVEPTFDKELHDILLEKRLNFGRYEDRRNISIEFHEDGVRGAQQDTIVEGSDPIYDSTLAPLKKSLDTVPEWLMEILPFLFNISSNWINERVRK